MIPRKIYLRENELKEQFMCERIERYKNDPFPVELIDENCAVIKVL